MAIGIFWSWDFYNLAFIIYKDISFFEKETSRVVYNLQIIK